MNSDMSAYLGVFLDEAAEQLSLLERECVELECSADPKELLQDLFRAAHTVKGASRAMGFIRIGDLTHEMENVLDELRNDRLPLSRATVDALLCGTDALRVLLDDVRESGSEPDRAFEEVDKAVKDLKASLAETPAKDPAEPARSPIGDVAPPRADGVAISVELSAETEMKGCRALLLLQAVGEWADVVGTVPDEEKLGEEQFESTFQILVTQQTASPELPGRIASILEVQSACYVHERKVPEPDEVAEVKDRVLKTAAPANQSQTVRVDVSRLDKLLNLVGELVIDRTQLMTQLNRARTESNIGNGLTSLDEVLGRIDRVT